MPRVKQIIDKFSKFFVIFLVIFVWIIENGSLIEKSLKVPLGAFAEEIATSTNTTTTSTIEFVTSTTTNTTTTSSITETPQTEELIEEGGAPEEIIQPQELPQLQLPPLKERKLDKEIKIAKNAKHSCSAKNFKIDLTGIDKTIVEFILEGVRSDSENIEIGSLPLGIDITFLNNGDYTYVPGKGDNVFVLQIKNQPGSQKGNFSIPIIYTSGDSTTICQINVINF